MALTDHWAVRRSQSSESLISIAIIKGPTWAAYIYIYSWRIPSWYSRFWIPCTAIATAILTGYGSLFHDRLSERYDPMTYNYYLDKPLPDKAHYHAAQLQCLAQLRILLKHNDHVHIATTYMPTWLNYSNEISHDIEQQSHWLAADSSTEDQWIINIHDWPPASECWTHNSIFIILSQIIFDF